MSAQSVQIECSIVVVNKQVEECDVEIDRHYGRGMDEQDLGEKGCFGNPYKVGPDGTREVVVSRFMDYFIDQWQNDPQLRSWWAQKLKENDTLRLGCHCAPKDCHGDVIKSVLESAILAEPTVEQ